MFTLSFTLRLKVWAPCGAGGYANRGTVHSRHLAQGDNAPASNSWARVYAPGSSAGRLAHFQTRRPRTNFAIGKTSVHPRRPPRARAAGSAVSSNPSPPRLRTPPPAQPAAQQRGAPRAEQGLIPDPGVRPPAGGPVGAVDKGALQGRGGGAGRAWKALETGRGTHHGRGRTSSDPRRLRASRTSRPGT